MPLSFKALPSLSHAVIFPPTKIASFLPLFLSVYASIPKIVSLSRLFASPKPITF